MLGPAALAVSQLKVALKPTAGFEQQLYASTEQYTEPGVFQVQGPNSGVYNANLADSQILQSNPQELVAVLNNEVNSASNIVVTVTGTDQNGLAYTGVATIQSPSYTNFQENVFCRGYGADLVPGTVGQLCKTITGVSVTCGNDVAPCEIKIIGLPSFSTPQSATGAYRLISNKTKLDYNIGAPDAHPVQSGRDKSAYVKGGEIPEKTVSITQKINSMGDGLMKINGVSVTGLVREIKEDKVETMRIYLPGLTITAEPSLGQSVEDGEMTGKGFRERTVIMIAH